MLQVDNRSPETTANRARKRVLNAGSGPKGSDRLHPYFRNASWQDVRMDIDEAVRPDLVGSITDLGQIADATFDAVWCSHSLEHLHQHEVAIALKAFRRILTPGGFALITCPDLEAIAALIVGGRLEEAAYQSPAGPITALEMLYGHGPSIAQGQIFMAHRTGFTADRIGRLLLEADFCEALVTKGRTFDLWALALTREAARHELQHQFGATGLNFFE
jgi:SAM-dependent methyltransferase